MDNLQNLQNSFVPFNFAYPDDFTGFGDVGCGCNDCGGLGDFSDIRVNSKGQTISCSRNKNGKENCFVVSQPRQGTRINIPKSVNVYNVRETDPYTPIRPNVNIYNDVPPRQPLPTAMQSQTPASVTPQKQGFYDKSLDAWLAFNRNKNERDIALAQAGYNAVAQTQNSQTQYPNNQYEPQTPGINPNTKDQVANAGAFAGEAAGSAIDGVVQFVSKNPLIVGLIGLGIFLFLKEPPRKGAKF